MTPSRHPKEGAGLPLSGGDAADPSATPYRESRNSGLMSFAKSLGDELGVQVLGNFLHLAISETEHLAIGIVVSPARFGARVTACLHRNIIALGDEVVRRNRQSTFELSGKRRQKLLDKFLLTVEGAGVFRSADNSKPDIICHPVEKSLAVAFRQFANRLRMTSLFSAALIVSAPRFASLKSLTFRTIASLRRPATRRQRRERLYAKSATA